MALLIDRHGPPATAREPRLFPDPVTPAPHAPARSAPTAPHAPEPSAEHAAAASGPTLDDLLTGTWGRLTAGVATACPVCAGELTPRWSAGAGIVGGRCGDCGSELD